MTELDANESTHPAAGVSERLRLDITGMTCASCAARIERKLNKMGGVIASVNYATEQARIDVGAECQEVPVASLIEAVTSMGYGATLHQPPSPNSSDGAGTTRTDLLRRRLILSAALTLPVVLVSMIPALQFDRWQWVVFALATPVVLWGGLPFHRATAMNARHGATTMDTLISIGTISAYLWSLYALVIGHAGMRGMRMSFALTLQRDRTAEHLYFEVASAVIVFLLAGRYFETRAKRQAGAALRALLSLGAKTATVIDASGMERAVDIESLRVGDRFIVRPGEKIATDGIVERGTSTVDVSLLTGESLPIEVSPESPVTGATLNVGGQIVVRASRIGAETALAQMARLVEEAQSGKAPVQRLADRISAIFVPIVIGIAFLTFAGWLLHGDGLRTAFTAAISVLIIACPCALGLATPTALLVGTGRAAQLGIVIRGPEVLESTREVNTIVFDKTGTITTGVMSVIEIVTDQHCDKDQVLRLVGALEHASEHPIGRAIANARQGGDQPFPIVAHFANDAGRGVSGTVEGHRVLAGRLSWCEDHRASISPALRLAWQQIELQGNTAIVGVIDEEAVAVFAIADTPKPTSGEAVRRLSELGLRPVLLTGDNLSVARRVGDAVGISDVVAGVLPAEKVAHIASLQRNGDVVAMVGDGVNDAAALAQADLGIAMGTGTDAAIEAADLTLVRGDLDATVDAIRLSRRTLKTIKANLFWAFAYNVAAIPLAAFGYLNPLVAGAAMAFSSVFVVSNSLRLRNFSSDRSG
jgi:P-type Cu+ transporter